jgi:DNA invertase Pin-like site-specific DNA recombinase
MVAAFSYVRFSHPDQAKGDSLRRQTDRAAEYCKRRGWTLDHKLSLRDLGVSAFKGKNAAVGNFRTFLDGIKSGHVPPGSVLLVESFDRISRQGIDEGYDLIKGILKAGVKIITLSPEREFDIEATRGLTKGALEIQLILERAAEESEMKSKRVGTAWDRKRNEAADRVVTRKLPGWIVYDEAAAKLVLDPIKAVTVRRIFELARDGHGVGAIAKRLNAEGVPVMGRKEFKGRTVVWNETVVYYVLKSRATFGEFQPCKGRGSTRKPARPPVLNYFPAVITADLYHAVWAVIKARSTVGRGRRGSHINLFAGLLVDARDGGTLTYKHLAGKPSALVPVGAKQGRGTPWTSFPLAPFEEAVLGELAEIKPRDVFPRDGTANEIDALEGRLAEIDTLSATWKAKMDNPAIVDVVAEKLAELNGQRKALVAELEAARQEAADPADDAWGRFRSLAALLKNSPNDDTKTAVRTALRRAVEKVYCVFTGSGRIRLAGVRVQFRGTDRHRDYVIAYEPGRSNHHIKRAGQARHVSAAWTDGPNELDLRNPKDAVKVERLLRALDFGDRQQ